MTLPQTKKTRISLLAVGLILIVAAIALFTIRQALPTSPPTPTPRLTDLGMNLIQQRAFPSLSYGIQAFLWWDTNQRSLDLERVRQIRFQYVKQIIDWNDVRADASFPYDWSRLDPLIGEVQYRGLKLIARIGKPPYWVLKAKDSNPNDPPFDTQTVEEWCNALASRYKGRIAGYQVWNEPNLAREWDDRPPNPAAYVKLLAACYKGVKAGDPAGIVISAPLAPTGNDDAMAMTDERYLQGMFDAGLSNYYDVLGLNAPGYKSPPETPPDDPVLGGNRWQAFRHVEDMRAIQVGRGDGTKQVALLEVGWTTDQRNTIKDTNGTRIPNPYRWHAVTPQQQADYLVHAYDYAGQHWQPFVGLMVTIYLPDPKWTKQDEEYWWSIIRPDAGQFGAIQPAYIALANMGRYMDDVILPTKDPGLLDFTPMPPYIPTSTPTP